MRNSADRAYLDALRGVPDMIPAGVSNAFFDGFIAVDGKFQGRARRTALMEYFDSQLPTMNSSELDFFSVNWTDNISGDPFAPDAYERYFEAKINVLTVSEALVVIGRFAHAKVGKNSFRNRAIERFVTLNIVRFSDIEVDQAIEALADTDLLFLPTDPNITIKQNFTKNSRARVTDRIRAVQAAARGR